MSHQTQTGHIAIGWLVVEDIFTVLVLVLVPALAGQGGQHAGNALLSIGSAVGKIALLIAITFFVGKRWLPEFLGWVAATRSRELFTLSVLAVALGIAVSSATLFGASMALGAFLAGMIVNQSAYPRLGPPKDPVPAGRYAKSTRRSGLTRAPNRIAPIIC